MSRGAVRFPTLAIITPITIIALWVRRSIIHYHRHPRGARHRQFCFSPDAVRPADTGYRLGAAGLLRFARVHRREGHHVVCR